MTRDFVYISELGRHVGESVTLKGWLYQKRSSGRIKFLVLRDGTGYLQCVAFAKDVSPELFETCDRAPLESSIVVRGTVRKDDRAPGGFELGLEQVSIAHEAAEYPIQPKEHGVEFLFDHRHLYLRSRTPQSVIKVRNEVVQACRDFFYQRDFVLIDSPVLTPAACEGTTTLFETDYFGDKAYLTQSGQLYLEPACMAFGRVYCFGPTFRAEKSKTRRHLTEFWMIEPEVAWMELPGLLELAEEFVAYVVGRALDRCKEELKFLERDLAALERVVPPFPKITYDAAAEILSTPEAQAKMKDAGAPPFVTGNDFGGFDETVLTQGFDRPVMVTHWPAEIKAFYMQPDAADPSKALCVDVIAPEGYGEIIGGSQRVHDHDLLLQRIRAHGLPVEAFQWYLDIRKYGTVPHSGFGMGVERCVAWICGIQHLREAIPYPRQINRLYPVKRIGVISLGCSKNLVDTEVMLGHLEGAGCTFVQDPADADVIVVNTCSFIEDARAESIQTILDAASHKKTGRLQKLVVAGCLVQRYRDELARELPEVDAFIGLDQLHEVVGAVGAFPAPVPLRNDLPMLPNPGPARYLYDAATPRRLATPRWTAFVKIAEGCDHTCSFCAIPSFRGVFRSRPAADVVAEAEALARRGVREINLIAQDSSHYGRDRGEREGLAGLLSALNEIEALRWIRVHYLYPNTVTPALIDAMARLDRVVKYVDMPLQHAHPDMLKRMRRGGSAASHLELLGRFRRAMPDAALRTTLIVGFPGETDVEFDELCTFVRAAEFDHLGVFTYSHEESTSAHALDDDIPADVKAARRDRLMALQQAIAVQRNERLIGRTLEAVVEGPHPETEHLLAARLSTQAPDVDGQVLVNDGVAAPGAFVRIEITETAGYDVVGRIVGVL